MALVNNITHNHYNVVDADKILKKLTDMSEQFDAIKAKLDTQNTAIGEVKKDVDFIKGKLAASEGGLTAAEVSELNTILDGTTAKLQALDAETDSTETGGEGTGETV